MSDQRWRGAVIGLGGIGQGYDYALSADQAVLTHSQAFEVHPRFHLVAGVDQSSEARNRFTAKFGAPAYSSIDELYGNVQVDVAAVALPTEFHFKSAMKILEQRPRAIICEKPITFVVKEGEELVAAAESSNCHLLVNYIRRFEPGVNRIKAAIDAGTLGQIYKGCVWYSKGAVNNASHFIDMLSYLLGPAQDPQVIARGSDRGSSDADPDFAISFGASRFHFISIDADAYAISDLELLGTKGRIRYEDGGANISIQVVEDDPVYPGYRALGSATRIANDISRYQWYVLDALAKTLDGSDSTLASDGRSALETLRTVNRILGLRMAY